MKQSHTRLSAHPRQNNHSQDYQHIPDETITHKTISTSQTKQSHTRLSAHPRRNNHTQDYQHIPDETITHKTISTSQTKQSHTRLSAHPRRNNHTQDYHTLVFTVFQDTLWNYDCPNTTKWTQNAYRILFLQSIFILAWLQCLLGIWQGFNLIQKTLIISQGAILLWSWRVHKIIIHKVKRTLQQTQHHQQKSVTLTIL